MKHSNYFIININVRHKDLNEYLNRWFFFNSYIEFEMILHRRSQYENNIVFQYFDLIKLDVTLIIIDDPNFTPNSHCSFA